MSEEHAHHEQVILTPEQRLNRAHDNIEKYIQDVPLESPRLQAFAGKADFQQEMARLGASYRETPEEVIGRVGEIKAIKLLMIGETIRQRENGMKDYKPEKAMIEGLSKTLGRAFEEKGNSIHDYADTLLSIKNREIDKRSQQPQNPS
jgi:hypothetical protein